MGERTVRGIARASGPVESRDLSERTIRREGRGRAVRLRQGISGGRTVAARASVWPEAKGKGNWRGFKIGPFESERSVRDERPEGRGE